MDQIKTKPDKLQHAEKIANYAQLGISGIVLALQVANAVRNHKH